MRCPPLPPLDASRPKPAHISTHLGNGGGGGLRLGVGSTHLRRPAALERAPQHDVQEMESSVNTVAAISGRAVSRGVVLEAMAATSEQSWWTQADTYDEDELQGETEGHDRDSLAVDSSGVHDGNTSSDEDFCEHLLGLAAIGVEQRNALNSSGNTSTADAGAEASAHVLAGTEPSEACRLEVASQQFDVPELLDDLSSEEDEGAAAQRVAELQAFVTMLTTPEDEFRCVTTDEVN